MFHSKQNLISQLVYYTRYQKVTGFQDQDPFEHNKTLIDQALKGLLWPNVIFIYNPINASGLKQFQGASYIIFIFWYKNFAASLYFSFFYLILKMWKYPLIFERWHKKEAVTSSTCFLDGFVKKYLLCIYIYTYTYILKWLLERQNTLKKNRNIFLENSFGTVWDI